MASLRRTSLVADLRRLVTSSIERRNSRELRLAETKTRDEEIIRTYSIEEQRIDATMQSAALEANHARNEQNQSLFD